MEGERTGFLDGKRQFNRWRTVTDSRREEQGRRRKKKGALDDDDGDEGEAATGGDGRYSW